MVNTIALKELRPELPDVIAGIDSKFDRYIVTKRGKPVVMMMSIDDYDSLMETLDILSDKAGVKRIKKAQADLKKGKGVSLEAVHRRLKLV